MENIYIYTTSEIIARFGTQYRSYRKMAGMTQREKEMEDCRKAIWYLRDYMQNAPKAQRITVGAKTRHPSGIECEMVASCYCREIAQAFRELWFVGLIVDGVLTRPRGEMTKVSNAIREIEKHLAVLAEHEGT